MSSNIPRPPRSIATPCVQVCVVDGANGLCLGCYRTLPEIAGWSAMSDDRRAEITVDLDHRRLRGAPAPPGPDR